ncbi:MAG TPA: ATP-dependent zinc metalloprotease FtsH [Fibrobacteraceae bacterium]|nr:ATP-dependent zinc metalloprotease FtsH [Fibrobacteraceae bacterium]
MPQDNPLKESLPKVKSSSWRNKNFFLILFIIMLLLVLLRLYNDGLSQPVSRTQFLAWMQDSSVVLKSVQLQKSVDGVIVTGERMMTPKEQTEASQNRFLSGSGRRGGSPNTVQFRTYMLEVPNEMIDDWELKKHVEVSVIHEDTGWMEHLFAFLPLILVVVLFWMMMARQGGGAGGRGLFSFGKSKARLLDSGRQRTTFQDVAGCDEAKQDLEEIVHFLKNPKKYDQLGGRIPKGALLVGPPGTGKTLLGRAVAGEAGVPFFSMSGSDFVEMFVGVGASRVRDLFETGKKHAPCILFIDEIDAVGRQRGAGLGGGHDEREQTLNQLLVEMDGFAPNEGVILLAATNRPDVLDKALLRPGRFDRQIVVNLPDLKGREEILNVHLKKRKVPMSSDVEISTIARGTPGLAGADLENLVNEAALLAARYGNTQVTQMDFEEARDKLWMGAERRSLIMTEEEKRHTAYHEAGHALINLLCKNADPLHKVTIIPRGRALGVTMNLPERDQVSMSKENAEDRIAMLMGGRMAELLMFSHQSTGAANDIERATELARKMVTEWGFTEELGPVAHRSAGDEVFLGREISRPKDMSEKIAELIDDTIRRIIDEQVARVRQMLEENRNQLVALGEALFEHEVLDREEIDRVMRGETLHSTKKSRQYISRRQRELAEQGKPVEPPPVPSEAAPAESEKK